MNALQRVFDYHGRQVRTVLVDGEPHFVAKDVCEILEIGNSRDAVARLDDDERGVVLIDTLGGQQEMQSVTESGLYTLVLGSRKMEAKQFKKWVTADILPSIRRSGMYAIESLSKLQILEMAIESEKQRIQLVSKVEELTPKAEFFDSVADSKTAIPMAHAAKVLDVRGIGRNNLFKILRDVKILDRDNVPYQEYIDRGYFRTIEQKYNTPTGETRIDIRTLVYQKGLDYIRRLLTKETVIKLPGRVS